MVIITNGARLWQLHLPLALCMYSVISNIVFKSKATSKEQGFEKHPTQRDCKRFIKRSFCSVYLIGTCYLFEDILFGHSRKNNKMSVKLTPRSAKQRYLARPLEINGVLATLGLFKRRNIKWHFQRGKYCGHNPHLHSLLDSLFSPVTFIVLS